MIAEHPEHVVVDLSGVTFIDSSGLAVLIKAMQDIKEYGGKLTLAGINNNVRSIFEMARLDQVFLIDPRDDELLAAD
jgi:anti-sigma B factor antagonist